MHILKSSYTKIITSLFSAIILLSSCSVYRPKPVEPESVNYNGKEVYMQFIDSPEYIYILDDMEIEGNIIKARLRSDFQRMNTKNAIIIWKNEIGDLKYKDRYLVNINMNEVESVEEYKYSRSATILQTSGIAFGAFLIGFLIYQGT
ncbi:MAG: hypothetical protein ABFR62_14260 [Bacteroidota bacterium]